MPRLMPVYWKRIECVILLLGYTFNRQHGSHRVYVKDNAKRSIILAPHKKDITIPFIQGLIKELEIDREYFLQLLENC